MLFYKPKKFLFIVCTTLIGVGGYTSTVDASNLTNFDDQRMPITRPTKIPPLTHNGETTFPEDRNRVHQTEHVQDSNEWSQYILGANQYIFSVMGKSILSDILYGPLFNYIAPIQNGIIGLNYFFPNWKETALGQKLSPTADAILWVNGCQDKVVETLLSSVKTTSSSFLSYWMPSSE